MHCGDDVFPLYLTPFYKPHSPKYGDSTLGVGKQTEAHRSVSAVKPIIWKRSWVRSEYGFGDMKGV